MRAPCVRWGARSHLPPPVTGQPARAELFARPLRRGRQRPKKAGGQGTSPYTLWQAAPGPDAHPSGFSDPRAACLSSSMENIDGLYQKPPEASNQICTLFATLSITMHEQTRFISRGKDGRIAFFEKLTSLSPLASSFCCRVKKGLPTCLNYPTRPLITIIDTVPSAGNTAPTCVTSRHKAL